MSQLIVRIDTRKPDVDLLKVKDNKEEIWKSLSLREFYKILQKNIPDEIRNTTPRIIDESVIAMCPGTTVFRIKKHERIVTYKDKAYRINFPDAVYVVRHSDASIRQVDAYTYMQWKGIDTVLYLMPMPNMTASERMCMGSADRKIRNSDVKAALNRILDAEYTHDHVDNTRGQMSTVRWFTYLKKNRVTKKDLKEPVCKLSDLVQK